MELRPNMYVRIINDIRAICIGIGKIKQINQETVYVDMKGNLPISFNKKQISKASNDITDLIEPQDLMYIDIDPKDGWGGIVVPRIAETLNELKKWKDRIKSGECKLVSVTTHESIESISYKVGD